MAQGKAYERRVGKELEALFPGGCDSFLAGPWFYFLDETGIHYCQPDFIILLARRLIVIECKLSYVADAKEKLETLYAPVVEHYFKRPVSSCVVARNMTRAAQGQRVLVQPSSALDFLDRDFKVLHWMI